MVSFAFLRGKKKVLFPIMGVFVFLLILVGGRIFFENLAKKHETLNKDQNLIVEFFDNLQNPKTEENEIIPDPKKISPLTGLVIPRETEIEPIAVIIENHPAARIQMRGLDQAGIVYEALAEGGITRFLAIFDTSMKKQIGPVRSARPYFIEWAKEFGGSFIHAGGSTEALKALSRSNLSDFDEDGVIVYRDFQYLKPHNLFVNLKAVREASLMDASLKNSWFEFGNEVPKSAISAKQFSLNFSSSSYLVNYDYDAEDGKYDRLLGGTEHLTNEGVMVRPTNIIVQFTEYYPIDDEGRLRLKTDGENVAWYFSEGKMWKGVWKKTKEKTEFFDNTGSLLKLQPGQTFIEVLDSEMKVKLF